MKAKNLLFLALAPFLFAACFEATNSHLAKMEKHSGEAVDEMEKLDQTSSRAVDQMEIYHAEMKSIAESLKSISTEFVTIREKIDSVMELFVNEFKKEVPPAPVEKFKDDKQKELTEEEFEALFNQDDKKPTKTPPVTPPTEPTEEQPKK